MSAKNVWSCLVTGGLVTGCLVTSLLLPAGLARAQSNQSKTQPEVGPGDAQTIEDPPKASRDQAPAASLVQPAAPTSTNDTMLWFRKTFVLFPAGGTSPLRLTDGAPPTLSPALVLPAAPPVGVPGTVQNVRRADNG